jgi:glycerol-3-phosphate dehydrogenase
MLKSDGLTGAVVYYDGQHNDTRMNLLIALTACQAGATLANYTEVRGITHDASTGKANGAVVVDRMTGRQLQVRARGVVNATGCFGDAIRKMDSPSAEPLIQGAAGVHIVLPDHFSPDNMGLIVPKTKDGRVLFFLPWENMTILGTTDSPSDITMTPAATEDDVRFILEESNRYLNREVKPSDVKAAWSGIRPLIKDPAKLASGKGTAQLSRKHVVEVSPTGMVSILGGKWTTYRRMAQDAVDKFAFVQGIKVAPSTTLTGQLLGADREGVVFNQKYDRIPVTLRESFGFDKDVARHLARNYGTRALQVAMLAQQQPELGQRLAPGFPFLAAEVAFAVEQEFAQTAVDVLARRTRLAYTSYQTAFDVLPRVVELMGQRLQWDAARRQREVQEAAAFLRTMAPPDQLPAFAAEAAEKEKTMLKKSPKLF